MNLKSNISKGKCVKCFHLFGLVFPFILKTIICICLYQIQSTFKQMVVIAFKWKYSISSQSNDYDFPLCQLVEVDFAININGLGIIYC